MSVCLASWMRMQLIFVLKWWRLADYYLFWHVHSFLQKLIYWLGVLPSHPWAENWFICQNFTQSVFDDKSDKFATTLITFSNLHFEGFF